MENLNIRISPDDMRFIDQLVATGTYSSKTAVARAALDDFIAKYTNRPTLQSLDDQVKRLRARVDKNEEEHKDFRRALEGVL